MGTKKDVEAAPPASSRAANEQRIAERHACEGFAEVVVPASGFLLRGEIIDLSEFGCFVKTRARLNVRRSSPLELRFTVNGEHFSVEARIAAIRPEVGLGIEFAVIETALHKNLLELITELTCRQNGRPETRSKARAESKREKS